MIEKIKVTVNGKEYEYSKDTTLQEIYMEHQLEFRFPIIIARVNGRLKELSSTLSEDCEVEFLDLTSSEGNRVHVNGLIFILLYCINKLYGNGANILVQHSLDKGVYIKTSFKLTEVKLAAIEALVKEVIKKDMPSIAPANNKIPSITSPFILTKLYHKNSDKSTPVKREDCSYSSSIRNFVLLRTTRSIFLMLGRHSSNSRSQSLWV